jgi:hypothetical protein
MRLFIFLFFVDFLGQRLTVTLYRSTPVPDNQSEMTLKRQDFISVRQLEKIEKEAFRYAA